MEVQEKNTGNTSQLKNYIKIARPDHWIKNAFIIPGLVLAVVLIGKPENMVSFLVKLIAGFFATCFIASANYVINEWLDAENLLLGLKPSNLLSNSLENAWWKCQNCNRKYPLAINKRVMKNKRGQNACPFCSGRRWKQIHFV